MTLETRPSSSFYISISLIFLHALRLYTPARVRAIHLPLSTWFISRGELIFRIFLLSRIDTGDSARMRAQAFVPRLYLEMDFTGGWRGRSYLGGRVLRIFSPCNLRIENSFYLWLKAPPLLIRDELV